jgi:phosphatidylserine/phosphatidylglycerophosphate/cardiolipin synthase-like enzyme
MQELFARVDAVLGERLEKAVRNHHRRRLRRVGWQRALDPSTDGRACNGFELTAGNKVELLVDGAETLPAIAQAIAGAESHVHIAGWYFSPNFRLEPGGKTLKELLAEAAERVDVRVLAWAGSPLPLFHPDRNDVREVADRLTNGTRIRMALDAKERPMHCHHEKVVVIDDRIAFVGGIDLTMNQGDRFDHSAHPARGAVGWHDASARLEGPAVGDVAAHFRLRWEAVTGESLPQAPRPPAAGTTPVQVVRTVPEHVYDAIPNGDFSILEAYIGALRGAEQYVYLENQFLWSPEIVAVLAGKLEDPPCDGFRLVILLPVRANNGQDDTRGQLGVLAEADDGAGRMLACTLIQSGTHPPQEIYVHAKVGIVDDRWLTLGSANLNEHSLLNDTEMNLVVPDPELARSLRLKLWSEHLECDLDGDGNVTELVDEVWRPRAEQELERIKRGEAPRHRLVLLPGVSHRTRRLLGPINGLFVDG